MRPALVIAPQAIPLGEAMLCLTCELVYAGTVCPRCADRFNWPLAAWLHRPETAAERSFRESEAA